MDSVIVGAIIGGTAAFLWVGIHFGSKWVDKMLHFKPVDPNKPIVRKHPLD